MQPLKSPLPQQFMDDPQSMYTDRSSVPVGVETLVSVRESEINILNAKTPGRGTIRPSGQRGLEMQASFKDLPRIPQRTSSLSSYSFKCY